MQSRGRGFCNIEQTPRPGKPGRGVSFCCAKWRSCSPPHYHYSSHLVGPSNHTENCLPLTTGRHRGQHGLQYLCLCTLKEVLVSVLIRRRATELRGRLEKEIQKYVPR